MKFSRKLQRAQNKAADAEQEMRCDLLDAWFRNEDRLPPPELASWLGAIAHSARRAGGFVAPGVTVFDREFPSLAQWVRELLCAQHELEAAATLGIGAEKDITHDAVVYAAVAERWGNSGYPCVRLEDQTSAALCLTDSSRAEVENALPWGAFLLTAPECTLSYNVSGVVHYAKWILVGQAGAGGVSVTLVPANGGWPMLIAIGDTVDELLASRNNWEQHAVTCEMAVNLVRGVLVQMQAGKLRQLTVARSGPHNRWREPGALPETTDYVLGHDVVLRPDQDYLDAARTIAAGTTRLYKVQWMVRGHQRWQAHGPRHRLRKPIWVVPHMKGRVDAPILRRDYVLTGEEQ